MKINNIKKLLLKNLILCGVFMMTTNINSYAKRSAESENIDITNKSIIKSFGGSLTEDFRSVIETKDNGFIAVGYSESTDIGFENKGNGDAIIVKYSKNGVQEWVNGFGGSKWDSFNSVVETQDGGFIAVGESVSTDAGFNNNSRAGYPDAILVKYDKDGNQEWIKSFGGANADYFNCIIETSNEKFIAIGESYSTDAGFQNKGYYDSFIIQYDKDGNQEWITSFGGSNWDCFNSLIRTQDGGFVIAGFSHSTDAGFENRGGCDIVIVKYDRNGNQEWIKNFGGSNDEYVKAIIETRDKGFIIVGYSLSIDAGFTNNGLDDAIIIKCDRNGNQEWITSFGGSGRDYFNSVTEAKDGGFIIVGESNSSDMECINKGAYDSLIVKYDKGGNQEWIKFFGGSNDDYFNLIIKSKSGDFIISGCSNSIDAGFENKGEWEAIILWYNPDYEHIFDKITNAENTNNVLDIEISRDSANIISEGIFKEYFQDRINKIDFNETLELKIASANLDLYIKCENILLMSLDTNSVTFEDFSGIEDVEKTNAVNISINSSLPYQLNAYLPVEIQNTDKTNSIDKSILNIKENSEADYKEFINLNEKVVLKDNCPAGNNLTHGVDLKLVGGIAHEKDVYKTTIKFEAEQK